MIPSVYTDDGRGAGGRMRDVTRDGLGARIVITGATDFIRSNPARVFLEHGDHVFVLARPGPRRRDVLPVHDNLTTVECDLNHAPDCIPAIGRADVLPHLAWGGVNREEVDSPKVQARNVSGSLDCARTTAYLDCTVFMDAGSRVEYGAVEGIMQEDMECHPVNQCGKAKLEFYQKAAPFCEEPNMSYYHLRFFSVYEYGDHPWSTISTLVRDLEQNKRVSLSACRHQWNFMYIEGAVQTAYELHRYGTPPMGLRSCIVNIVSPDTKSPRFFVEEIHKAAGFRGELEYGASVQAEEGVLPIWPGIGRLLRFAGGDWEEEYTLCRGIKGTIEKEGADRRHEEDQHIDSLL